MSKFIPDPQIQSQQAMRRGDISFADGGIKTIGVAKVAFAQPLISLARSLPAAVPALEAVIGPINESPIISRAIATTLSVDVAISVSLLTTNALETPIFPAGETPVIGVAFSTSVV